MGKYITGLVSIVGLLITVMAAWFILKAPLLGEPLPPRVHLVGAATWFVVGAMMLVWSTKKFVTPTGTERPDVDHSRLRTYKR
ncbi:hypothetical protein G9464_09380 [Halostella sp. JP-L12]|uniref:hypothetical protein n=1 Tax=Halostella TaxID=1843185 RepID=UPI0013CE565F|nr:MULTISPECIES: hypothetical protein [Halostella]NHN47806.1 hypothetical protein [Halostella sp. JP-L12]